MAPGRTPLVLASASPRRLDLLRQIGLIPDEVLPAAIDEASLRDEPPRAHALRLARRKAETVAALRPEARVLAADTVVALGRRILPKAEDETQARRCLELLSGRRHRVFSALCLIAPGAAPRCRLSESVVAFKRLTPDEIAAYLAGGEWKGKAGGYAVQGAAAGLIRWLAGSYSGVVGLPLYDVRALLADAGD
ncbi:MAG: septum formation protein Maf [Alphaproteobacteria bacterium]|nr:septum formation protein Maf [Alphaproteobacteria bacterium]